MIRPATLDDLPVLLALGEHMHAESRYRVMRFSAAKLEATLRAVIASPMGFLWVAESEGAVTGALAAMCSPHWASDDLMAVDLALFFSREHRGGIGAMRLVTQYRQWARGLGAKIVDLGVSTGVYPERTANLFDRLGFPRCGTIHSAEN